MDLGHLQRPISSRTLLVCFHLVVPPKLFFAGERSKQVRVEVVSKPTVLEVICVQGVLVRPIQRPGIKGAAQNSCNTDVQILRVACLVRKMLDVAEATKTWLAEQWTMPALLAGFEKHPPPPPRLCL